MPPEDEPLNPENIALDSINTAAVDTVSDEPDDCTTLEQYELLKKKAELDSYTSDTASRKEYAKKIFVLTCLWVGGIYVLLLFQGFGYNGFGWEFGNACCDRQHNGQHHRRIPDCHALFLSREEVVTSFRLCDSFGSFSGGFTLSTSFITSSNGSGMCGIGFSLVACFGAIGRFL